MIPTRSWKPSNGVRSRRSSRRRPTAKNRERPISPLYCERNLVERFFNKLKHFRAVATRYEKHASNYLALIKLAATRIWLRSYESVA